MAIDKLILIEFVILHSFLLYFGYVWFSLHHIIIMKEWLVWLVKNGSRPQGSKIAFNCNLQFPRAQHSSIMK
jgi:hypothetical protein